MVSIFSIGILHGLMVPFLGAVTFEGSGRALLSSLEENLICARLAFTLVSIFPPSPLISDMFWGVTSMKCNSEFTVRQVQPCVEEVTSDAFSSAVTTKRKLTVWTIAELPGKPPFGIGKEFTGDFSRHCSCRLTWWQGQTAVAARLS